MYILDSNIFIQAYRTYYAFDIAPKFWDELNNHSSNGNIASIDRVQNELINGGDQLSSWIGNNCACTFVPTDDSNTISAYTQIMRWAQSTPRFSQNAISEFAKVADGWIVAYAMANSCTVATLEISQPNGRSRVKIPDVCQAFSVPFTDTFTMLRRLGVSFS